MAAIVGPTKAALTHIQVATKEPSAIGWTSNPERAQAPQCDYNITSETTADKTTSTKQWYAKPTQSKHADPGDSSSWYVEAGTNKTNRTEDDKRVYFIVSEEMSARACAAEEEHSEDIKLAYDISLKEVDDALNSGVIGETFGPKDTELAVKRLVDREILRKLTPAHKTHLGYDQTKWASIYETLYSKTKQRDDKGWHSFGLGDRATKESGEVTYKVNAGTTSIGETPSHKVVKY